MESLLGVAGFLLAGIATPGPNNLVVWHTTSRGGFAGTMPAVAGIVLGGLGLLALAMSSVDAVPIPGLRTLLTVGGCIYLTWLGIGFIVHPAADNHANSGTFAKLPEGFAGLFLFQFLNPKGWILMVTVASALPAAPWITRYMQVALLFLIISVTCLSLWAVLGAVFTPAQSRLGRSSWFERSMGCLLIGSAVLLVIGK